MPRRPAAKKERAARATRPVQPVAVGSARAVADLDAAVLRPAVLARVGADRLFLAEAVDRELRGLPARGLHRRRDRVAATLAEGHVVVAAAALVGMPVERHARGRTIAQV